MSQPTIEQQQEYYDELQAHDWYYRYSDNNTVYRKGQAVFIRLREKGRHNPVYQEMWNSWKNYVQVSSDALKPKRPE